MDSKTTIQKIIEEARIRFEKYPRQYPLPAEAMQPPFQSGINAFHFSEKNKIIEWVNWCALFSLIPHNRFDHGLVIFVSAFYPGCTDLYRYENLTKMVVTFYVIDEHNETAWGDQSSDCLDVYGQFNLMLDKLVSKEFIPMNGFKPYILAIYAVFESVCSEYNESQKQRMVESWKHYIQGNVEEQQVTRNKVRFESIEHLEEIRLKSIGVRPSIQFIEYSDNICLEDNDWVDSRLQRLIDLISMNVVYSNDIFSFEKEIRNNQQHPERLFNLVALIHLLEKCSYAEAMEKVTASYVENSHQVQIVLDQINSDQASSESLKEFANKAVYIGSGTVIAQLAVNRYNKPQNI